MSPFRVHLIRTFFNTFAQTLVFTTWMIYQQQAMGLNALQLVLVGTAMELTIFLFEIPTGVVADVYSRRLSVIIGQFLMGAAYLVMGGIPAFAAAIGSQFLWGIGYTFTSGAYDAWMVDELGQARAGEAFLRAGQIGRIAGLIGIPVSTLLATIHLGLPILIGGGMQILTGLLLIAIMPERGFTPAPVDERATWRRWTDTFLGGLHIIRSQPALLNILAVSWFFGLFSEGWDRLWQAHLVSTIGLPPTFQVVVWIGIIRMLESVLDIGAIEGLRRRLDSSNRHLTARSLFALTAVMVVSLMSFALTSSLALALGAYFAFTIARGLIEPILATWTNQHIESSVRATVLSMQSQVDAIGQIIGGPPVGALGQRSLRLALAASSVILSPALLLLARARRHERAKDS